MRRPRLMLLLVPVLVVAAGCGGGGGGGASNGAGTAAAATTEIRAVTGASLRVGLVTEAGGRDVGSLSSRAGEGLRRARDELGAAGRVVVSRSRSGYLPSLSALAQEDYDLVIGVGSSMARAVETAAGRFPDTDFAIVDFPQAAMRSEPPNVRGLLFAEQEAGYLVGYLAGLVVAETGGANPTVSSVGGRKIPRVDRYIAGFRAGARAASPGIATLNDYSRDLVDQAKCKEIALDQISRGSTIVFGVAGQCSFGALNAAAEQNVQAVGADADQAHLGDHILSSALKRVDVAVYQTIQEVQDGAFAGGEDAVFDVASGGVGLGTVSAEVPGEIIARVNGVQTRIASGAIDDIPEEVG